MNTNSKIRWLIALTLALLIALAVGSGVADSVIDVVGPEGEYIYGVKKDTILGSISYVKIDDETTAADAWTKTLLDSEGHVVDHNNALDAGSYKIKVYLERDSIPYTGYKNIVVKRGAVSVTWNSESTSLPYKGHTLNEVTTMLVTNVKINGQDYNNGQGLPPGFSFSVEGTSFPNVGNYNLTLSYPTTNYDLEGSASKAFSIKPAEITVEPADTPNETTYGEIINLKDTFDLSSDNDETPESLKDKVAVSCNGTRWDSTTLSDITEIEDAGNYTIMVTVDSTYANNYTLGESTTGVEITYTVKKAQIDVSAKTGERYNKTGIEPINAVILPNGTDETVTATATIGSTIFPTIIDAGTYTITVELNSVDNKNNYILYNGTDTGNPVTVTYYLDKAPITAIKLEEDGKVYDGIATTEDDFEIVEFTELFGEDKLIKGSDYIISGSAISAKDAGPYTITVTVTEDCQNYTGTVDAPYVISRAPITSIVLAPGYEEKDYNTKETNPNTLANTVTATLGNEQTQTQVVPSEQYSLIVKNGQILKEQGTYSISVELNNSAINYVVDTENPPEAEFTINPAKLFMLTLKASERIYSRSNGYGVVTDPNDLKNELSARAYDEDRTTQLYLPLSDDDYELESSPEPIEDVGEYTISIKEVKNRNYEDFDNLTATYKITPATLTSLVLGETTSVYNSARKVDLNAIQAMEGTVLKAMGDGQTEFVVPKDAYTLEFEVDPDGAGTYTVLAKIKSDNYEKEKVVSADYTLTTAKLDSLVLTDKDYIYNQETLDPNDLNLKPVVTDSEGNIVPTEFYSLAADKTVKDVGEYKITVVLTEDGKHYYEEDDGVSDTLTILPAEIKALTLERKESIYDSANPVSLAEIQKMEKTDLTAITDGDDISVPKSSYVLLPESIPDGAGTYTITVKLNDPNYKQVDPGVTATYTITAAALDTLELGDEDWVYNQKPLDPNEMNLKPVVKDEMGNVVAAEMYTLSVANMMNAGDYTIKVVLTDKATGLYTIKKDVTTPFTVLPAPIQKLTLGKNTSIYNRKEVSIANEDLLPVLTAKGDTVDGSVELIVPTESYTLKSLDGNLVNVGEYALQPVLKDTNYTDKDLTVTDAYTIEPATLLDVVLDPPELIYRKSGYVPETDLKGKDSLAAVRAVGNGEEDIFEVPLEDVELTCEYQVLDVGDYTIVATPVTDNYVKETTKETTLSIKLQQVDPIVITMDGIQGLTDGIYRLGGPVETAYHSFQITGEEEEKMTVTITDGTKSIVIPMTGGGTVTIKGNAITYNETTYALDTSGDVLYTIHAIYDDASNLKTAEAETASVEVLEYFYYDVNGKPGSVAETLMNRAATGITINAAEDYLKVELTGGGENSFTASSDYVATGGAHIPFVGDSGRKLYSTKHSSANTFGGVFTDLVGNTVSIDGQEIAQESGTLAINSLTPPPNVDGWIGETPMLTWSITMTATGGFDEVTRLTIGTTSDTKNLNQGENTWETVTDSLQKDTRMFVTISFDDLVGSATYQSFGYDNKADVPVVTTRLYDGCNVLSGIVEPNRKVTITVNGESITVNSDRYGIFTTDELPLAYEGDTVTIHYVDRAGNFVTLELTVGPEEDPVKLDAYMLGRLRTDAHKRDENAKWAYILNASKATLEAGVTLPIIAGNVVEVGEITLKMDEEGAISYSYTLNDGVELDGDETVVVDTNGDYDALMDLIGTKISSEGTKIEVKGKDPTYSFVAKFEVEVPAEELEQTFQTLDASEDELKRQFEERQTQRAI